MLPMANLAKEPDITFAVSYLAREREIDRIVALDDYDVETGAALREHLRLPGMGTSQARFFPATNWRCARRPITVAYRCRHSRP